MKKLLYLGFCAVLVAGVGCAISDYQIITDNDQAHDGQQVTNGTVNTNGKAHIRSFQIALIFGSFTEEAINFVDQKTNGDRTLTTYMNHSTIGLGGPTFHDDLYCNPDWTGCATWISHDPPGGFDRNGAGFAAFDGRFNVNCKTPGIQQIFATTRARRGNYNDGECGRMNVADVQKKITIMNMGELGEVGGESFLFYNIDQNNTTYMIGGELLPIYAQTIGLDFAGRRAFVTRTNPMNIRTMRRAGSIVEAGNAYDISITYNGIQFNKEIFFGRNPALKANLLY
jgi:hypothetical protein